METIQINKANAQKAYREADEKGKSLLSTLLGTDILNGEITDRIKTFEDACEAFDLDSDDEIFSEGSVDEIAYKKLKVIIEALREEWTPDWNDHNQYKWTPWFYMNEPGFRFGGAYFGLTSASTAGGSRLCFPSEKLATYAGKTFESLYKDFLTIS